MSGYTLSPEAEDDVFHIWRYLWLEAGPETANRIDLKFFKTFGELAQNPHLGHRRSDLTKVLALFYRVRPHSYMIVYRPQDPLEIVAVLHGSRDLDKALKERVG